MVDNAEQINTDEWYGTDDETIWEWVRDNKTIYRLQMDVETKKITLYEAEYSGNDFHRYKGELHKVRVFNDKDYMYESEPSLVEPDDGPDI
jgi:hypothetical protein